MARRKITEANELAAELAGDLPELTPQQFAFVGELLAGKTASDAYRAAYDCSGSSPATIWTNAARLRADTKVALWLTAARRASLGRLVPTAEQHCADLLELREESKAAGNYGAAVQAEQLRGKVAGHYVEQVADVTCDPARTLQEIAEHAPELAEALARHHGINFSEGTKH